MAALAGKTASVPGSTSGIGRASAEHLAAQITDAVVEIEARLAR